MVWTTVNDPIKLDIDWQFTEPVEGTFFRFRHESQPVNAIFEIAQVELNEDGSYTLFDSQILTVERGFTDSVKLAKPGIFAQRRLAIRKIPARPTFEQEIRRLLLPGYLQPNEDSPISVARNRWQVQIESSDYIESSATLDLTPIQTKLDEISSKIDNLETSGGNTGSSTSGHTLTYTSDGDANGVCYWLGTNKGTTAWSNPNNKLLILSASSIASGTLDSLVDRLDSEFFTSSDEPVAWVGINFQAGKFKPKHYSIKTRNQSTDFYPRSWKLKGRKSDTTLIDLDIQVNNTILNANNQWLTLPVATNDYYQQLRIELSLNSSNFKHLVLGKIEFYGEYL